VVKRKFISSTFAGISQIAMRVPHYVSVIAIAFLLPFIAASQSHFTPNDDLPGLVKSYKPSYDEGFPEWAKMLYAPEINFEEINSAFEEYITGHPTEKSAIVRYYKNWRRAVSDFVRDDGTIELPDMEMYYEKLRKEQEGARSLLRRDDVGDRGIWGQGEWSFLGPKETFWLNEQGSPTDPASCPWQVNVYSLDVAETDNNILYVGTETGFVNKTTDKGLTWQLMAPGYYFGGPVTAVAIDPTDAATVYVSAGNQVHKSTDGGLTWTPLLPAGGQFYADRLRIDPDNPEKLVAAAPTGVYVSFNGGETWTRKWTSASYDVEFKPNSISTIFALTKSGANFSMIQSVDGGQSFTAMAGFPATYVESSGGLLAVTPDNPNILMVILLSSNNTPYLLKGMLSGGNWTWALVATGQTTAFPMNNGQGYFDLVLDISPVNDNIILVGTTTLYRSMNAGSTFNAVGGYAGNFSIHPDIQDIRMLENGETWVSTDGGMNLTTDNFSSQANYHVRVNGLLGSDMWGFDQGWNEDILVGGRYHNGNTAMADFYQPKALRMGGAESPTGWVLQGKSRHVAFNDLGNGWILPKEAEGMPEGRFIFSKYPNMEEYGGRRGNLVFHPNYYGTIYLGEGTGFWKSEDCGETYELLHNFPNTVRYLQISYSNPDVIYADVVGQGLCKSTDGGLTWTLKPSLTSPPNGNSSWKGKLFFAISAYDEHKIYACLQNGTWSADIGKVFKSMDGGETWEDWTGTLSEYMKCMVVQPTMEGTDVVYLFTNATNGQAARVYYRKEGMTEWADFSTGYPAGMHVNMAFPFYRDSKLRVGGNASVWESPMLELEFPPIINPWVEKSFYNCMTDTLYFDDHSIINHAGATWHWEISPEPAYLSDADIRNPKVVLGSPGSYSVTMSVTKDGQTYTKTIGNMVTTTTCPSIEDCSNPAELPKNQWSLLYVDSEELNYPGLATMSFDSDPETIWHTRWSTGNDPYPHEIQVDLGGLYKIYKFTYLNRQDGENGRIRAFELYISEDNVDWGEPVMTGEFVNTAAPQTLEFPEGIVGRYWRLVGLSEVNGNPWASAAEFTMVGCTDIYFGTDERKETEEVSAFPVPTSGIVSIAAPPGSTVFYTLFSATGQLINHGTIEPMKNIFSLDLSSEMPGLYFVRFVTGSGTTFIARIIKE
jgi:photosystem II stability/assembly factor-like uncharacterized protein